MRDGIEAEILSYLKDHNERTSRQIQMHLVEEFKTMPHSTMWTNLVSLLNERRIKRRFDNNCAYWSVY
jgi:hypothetical protein